MLYNVTLCNLVLGLNHTTTEKILIYRFTSHLIKNYFVKQGGFNTFES